MQIEAGKIRVNLNAGMHAPRANQIGGSCAELKYKQHRLIIDLGLPLDAAGSQLELLSLKLKAP